LRQRLAAIENMSTSLTQPAQAQSLSPNGLEPDTGMAACSGMISHEFG
jgi:hypothetical protein